MNLPRQPGPVKVTISTAYPEDLDRAKDMIRRTLERHYASTTGYHDHVYEIYILHAYPFAVND